MWDRDAWCLPYVINIYMDEMLKEVRTRFGRKEMKLFKKGKEWNLSMLIYANDFVLVSESKFNLKIPIECFDLGCGRRHLKVHPGKSNVKVFGEIGTLC